MVEWSDGRVAPLPFAGRIETLWFQKQSCNKNILRHGGLDTLFAIAPSYSTTEVFMK
jgi:hypothetical protein